MGRRGGEARAALGRHFPAPLLGRKSATQAPRSYGCHDAPGDNLVAWGPRAKSDARCRRLVWSGTASRPAGAGRRGREGGFRFSGVSVSVTGTKKRMSCAAMTESANESDDRSKKKSCEKSISFSLAHCCSVEDLLVHQLKETTKPKNQRREGGLESSD